MRYGLWCILFLLVSPCRGYAQKAYELVRYTGKLQGKIVRLDLGNGYIGASKVSLIINPKQKPQIFLPESGVPDAPFILRSTQKGINDYFILDKMQDAFEELPAVINGKYLFNKKVLPVKFYLINK